MVCGKVLSLKFIRGCAFPGTASHKEGTVVALDDLGASPVVSTSMNDSSRIMAIETLTLQFSRTSSRTTVVHPLKRRL